MEWDIESADLGFRPLTDEDVSAAYVEWLNDPQINRYLEVRHGEQDEDTVGAYVNACLEDPSIVLMGVFERAGGTLIGTAELSGIEGRYRTANLEFMIGDAEFQGQGLGTQVVATMTEIGLVDLSLRKVSATVYEPNIAALRCLEHNAFREEGFLRDHFLIDDEPVGAFVLGRLRDEW